MTQLYQWTDDEDEVAMDAVTVSISSTSRILKIGGLEFGDPVAWVYWPERLTKQGVVVEKTEGRYDDVRPALAYAENAAHLHGFARVVIVLQDRALWNNNWGRLAAAPGLG
jgi:hypothetical protein